MIKPMGVPIDIMNYLFGKEVLAGVPFSAGMAESAGRMAMELSLNWISVLNV